MPDLERRHHNLTSASIGLSAIPLDALPRTESAANVNGTLSHVNFDSHLTHSFVFGFGPVWVPTENQFYGVVVSASAISLLLLIHLILINSASSKVQRG
ncbi:hypothetical protein BO94DRAFT_535849, partial [Aspergillus sclerotioniger CBS 115572]